VAEQHRASAAAAGVILFKANAQEVRSLADQFSHFAHELFKLRSR
jgi:hypothetical protein